MTLIRLIFMFFYFIPTIAFSVNSSFDSNGYSFQGLTAEENTTTEIRKKSNEYLKSTLKRSAVRTEYEMTVSLNSGQNVDIYFNYITGSFLFKYGKLGDLNFNTEKTLSLDRFIKNGTKLPDPLLYIPELESLLVVHENKFTIIHLTKDGLFDLDYKTYSTDQTIEHTPLPLSLQTTEGLRPALIFIGNEKLNIMLIPESFDDIDGEFGLSITSKLGTPFKNEMFRLIQTNEGSLIRTVDITGTVFLIDFTQSSPHTDSSREKLVQISNKTTTILTPISSVSRQIIWNDWMKSPLYSNDRHYYTTRLPNFSSPIAEVLKTPNLTPKMGFFQNLYYRFTKKRPDQILLYLLTKEEGEVIAREPHFALDTQKNPFVIYYTDKFFYIYDLIKEQRSHALPIQAAPNVATEGLSQLEFTELEDETQFAVYRPTPGSHQLILVTKMEIYIESKEETVVIYFSNPFYTTL